MEHRLSELTETLKAALGNKLRSLILYGSGAGGAASANSDLNLMIVLEDCPLELLDAAGPAIERFGKKPRIVPVFWSERELRSSADVFPVEFTDLKSRYRVLHGKDLPAELRIDSRNLRHQLEFELRSKILRLRSEWPKVRSSKALMEELLTQAGPSFLVLFNHAARGGTRTAEEEAEPFRECLRLKRKERTANADDLKKLYRSVHDAARRLAEAIDDSQGDRHV
jgi:hypothetical protein